MITQARVIVDIPTEQGSAEFSCNSAVFANVPDAVVVFLDGTQCVVQEALLPDEPAHSGGAGVQGISVSGARELIAGALPRLLQRLQRWVYAGRVAALIRSLRHLVGADARSEQARQELLGYVTRHAQAITAVDRLRPRVSPASRALLTHGTGAMEKNVEVWIARRFKRWGMRWTRRGAHHLLKVRLWIFRQGGHWFEALKPSAPQLTNA